MSRRVRIHAAAERRGRRMSSPAHDAARSVLIRTRSTEAA